MCDGRNAAPVRPSAAICLGVWPDPGSWPIRPFAVAMIGVLLRVTFVPVLTQLPVTLLGP
jgi:hypothetical protein